MKLNLNIEGFHFVFELREYDLDHENKRYPDYWWCEPYVCIEADFHGRNHLRYEGGNNALMCDEVDYLISCMNGFLEGKFSDEAPEEIGFTEPDWEFLMGKNDFQVTLFFWDNEGTAIESHLTLAFHKRENIEAFRDYLLLATGKVMAEDERIKRWIDNGFIVQ